MADFGSFGGISVSSLNNTQLSDTNGINGDWHGSCAAQWAPVNADRTLETLGQASITQDQPEYLTETVRCAKS